MKQLLIIGLILGLTNCSTGQQKLSDDKTIKESFSETEIQDLQILYDFFNETICDSNRDLENCYEDFFIKVVQAFDSGSIYLNIPFEDQLGIYEEFIDSTFYQIWAFSATESGEIENYRWNGKFMNFLKKAGEKDGFIKAYHESIEAIGVPSPSIVAQIIMNYDKPNIEDSKVKFVIAMHYLTINDQYERKEKNKSGANKG